MKNKLPKKGEGKLQTTALPSVFNINKSQRYVYMYTEEYKSYRHCDDACLKIHLHISRIKKKEKELVSETSDLPSFFDLRSVYEQ